MQAQKALGKNNRVVGGSIMIGVSACTDPSVVSGGNDDSIANGSMAGGLDGSSVHLGNVTNLNSSLGGTRLNSSIRPLTQAYKAAAKSENDVSLNSALFLKTR